MSWIDELEKVPKKSVNMEFWFILFEMRKKFLINYFWRWTKNLFELTRIDFLDDVDQFWRILERCSWFLNLLCEQMISKKLFWRQNFYDLFKTDQSFYSSLMISKKLFWRQNFNVFFESSLKLFNPFILLWWSLKIFLILELIVWTNDL